MGRLFERFRVRRSNASVGLWNKKIPPGRFVSESASAHRRSTVLANLRQLAEFRKERVIDEDVHKRIQIRILEKHLNIEGGGDVSI